MQLIKLIIRSLILSACTGLTLLSLSAQVHATSDLERGFAAQNNGDFSSAASYFQTASESGNSEAQYQLGLLYAEGSGIEKNLSKAITLIQQASDTAHLLAIEWLTQHGDLTTTSEEDDPEDDC
jgi:TPR repeat protein